MPPSAEATSTLRGAPREAPCGSSKLVLDRKVAAFAVNYETSFVENFTSSNPSNPRSSPHVENVPDSTTVLGLRPPPEKENPSASMIKSPGPSGRRKSSRDPKQRIANLTPARVRYDMELVPAVEKSKRRYDVLRVQTWPPTRTTAACSGSGTTSSSSYAADREGEIEIEPVLLNSLLWVPETRKGWEDSVSEMTAVCTSAALRKHHSSRQHLSFYTPTNKRSMNRSNAFAAPLSKEYIRDRIDIDDPLRGFQLRHHECGWLQGFVLWTNFTTWTHFFTWDSLHPQSGVKECPHAKDFDGALAQQLESMPRSGDPNDSGIVFPGVAEIALLGGLGCGELLLRLALEDIQKCGNYRYVVLQATTGSRSFYERFGFRRVGAVCRYGRVYPSNGNGTDSLPTNTTAVAPTLDTKIQSYRHWTHPHESQTSLDLHGGPSYMMCLKLPCTDCTLSSSLLRSSLKSSSTMEKPTIQPLGTTSSSPGTSTKRKIKGKSPFPSSPSPGPRRLLHSKRLSEQLDECALPYQLSPQPPTKRRQVSKDLGDVIAAISRGDPCCLCPSSSGAANSFSAVDVKKRKHREAALSKPKPRATTKHKKKKNSLAAQPRAFSDDTTSLYRQVVPTRNIQYVDKTILCKQKVKSYPRDRPHFYNKVVRRKRSTSLCGPFYFVLNYDEESQMMALCPMKPTGVLSGKRQGRPRYQCVLESTSASWISFAPTVDYDAVPAFMVMKTPLVAQEAWDVMGEDL